MQPAEAAAQPYPRSGFSTLVLKFRNYLFCDDLGLDDGQGWNSFDKQRAGSTGPRTRQTPLAGTDHSGLKE